MNKEDLVRRVRALLELARRGGSEEEMASASAKVQVLIARYNLSPEDLKDTDAPASVDEHRVEGKYNETWRRSCYGMAAKMYMCSYFYRSINAKTVGVIHSIVGEPQNALVAIEMAAYFEDAINRLANTAARGRPDLALDHTTRHRFIRTFRVAAAQRLSARIDEYVRNARAGRTVDVETGTTLPALADLYDRQLDAYAAWKLSNGMTVTSKTARDQLLSSEGRRLGARAGDSVSLNTQIKSGSASSRFALK